MQSLPPAAAQMIMDAGRPDLIPGHDGTVRLACRRMSGWRVSPERLAEAVRRHAPAVPVIAGADYPSAITYGQARQARRARQDRRG